MSRQNLSPSNQVVADMFYNSNWNITQIGGGKKKKNVSKVKNLISKCVDKIFPHSNSNDDFVKKQGSFSQSSIEFMHEDTVGTQCTTMSLMSIIHSHSKSPSRWTEEDLDMILLQGDKLHQLAIAKRYEHLNQTNQLPYVNEYRYLSVDDLLPVVPIEFNGQFYEFINNGAEINAIYFEQPNFGKYESNLTKEELNFAFMHTFPKYNNCVITIAEYSFAILYDVVELKYYLFDSHDRNNKSTLFFFPNINNMIDYFLNRFSQQGQKFEVNPLTISQVERNIDMSFEYSEIDESLNDSKILHSKKTGKISKNKNQSNI